MIIKCPHCKELVDIKKENVPCPKCGKFIPEVYRPTGRRD